ncbi:MAG: ComEA family DNA-binding protein [Sedimentisphaerales bacterium]
MQAETNQNRILSFAFVISVVVCVLFSMAFVASSVMSFGSLPGGCEIVLDEKINPNDASVASLVRLPNIGLVRAEAIVAYRENFREKNDEPRPFQDCNDLQKIRGIGPKTVQNLSEWLKFE